VALTVPLVILVSILSLTKKKNLKNNAKPSLPEGRERERERERDVRAVAALFY
jgi:hypothetical protein